VKVYADQDVCVGSGMCVLCLPEVFDQREDDGVVVLLRAEPDPDPDQEAAVLQAVQLCPSGALRVDR
jgi:ferredoxin